MNISELIKMGEEAAKKCYKNSEYVGEYYSGQEYEEWLTVAIRFVELNFPGDTDTKRFREIAQTANGFGNDRFYPLIGILKAFNEYPPIPVKEDILPLIKNICMNFNKFDIKIKRRYGNRETIKINDEHDLQDAIHSILKLFVDDIRPEDYVPSYAGGNSRVDFLLPKYGLIIETKMTNNVLHDKQVGEQLIIDFERYKQTNGYNHLVCFIYDREANISNPIGLITDLEKLSNEKMRMTVFISPQ
ncbi:hypothetical protein [Petroclostridium sp. X23]|uniref:PD-(D/E)XK nuclease domain-containing protein n=1 Tax=Petroclostridium sp. X23 TaxID=3045146 RepID=UPI0024AD1B2E|nr:hypothetical protein [Petroclostridium sp. X23]WHH58496.1 hypothetical protein QKW49_22285 [Petroclostridium sp. X23]